MPHPFDSYAPMEAKTIPEKLRDGADREKGLAGSMPINSQPNRYCRRVANDGTGYGEDLAHGVTYD